MRDREAKRERQSIDWSTVRDKVSPHMTYLTGNISASECTVSTRQHQSMPYAALFIIHTQ